ncbi:MAG: hypothetical protein K6A36_00315 [Paludibacteraceae bacterium]|nr:hypothetical protein [Paludibacteraceae bacterium]
MKVFRGISLTLVIAVILLGILFRYMHWPYSHELFIAAAVLLIIYIIAVIFRL